MKRLNLLFTCALFLPISLLAGTPHIGYGKLKYPDGSTPASVTFQAYMLVRPAEILTQTSFDCGYSSGTWYVQCGNFASPWVDGQILRVVFNDGAGKSGSVELPLTNDPGDNAGNTILTAALPLVVKLSIPDLTVQRGTTLELAIGLSGLAQKDSVLAYEITLEFDPDVLISVDASTEGTMTEPWGDPFLGPMESTTTVAAYTTNQPSTRMIPDAGNLVKVHFLVHGIPSSQTSRTTIVRFVEATIYTLYQTLVVSHTKCGAITVSDGTMPAERDVEIYPNWNLISFPILPEPNLVPDVFGSLPIVYVFGYQSGLGPRTWVKNRPINDLTMLDALHGYWVKSSGSAIENWHLEGDSVSIRTPIPMYSGWNLVAYLPTRSDSLRHALESLRSLYSYVMGYEGGVGPSTWVRNRPINDLNIITHLQGYWIKLDSMAFLQYPIGGYRVPKAIPFDLPELAFQDTTPVPTPYICDFSGEQPDLLFKGDVISVYDPDGILCGKTSVLDGGQFLVHVFGTDMDPAEDEGAVEGDTLSFFINGDTAVVVEGDCTWTTMGARQIELAYWVSGIQGHEDGLSPSSFILMQNYPNPFNGDTMIPYRIGRQSRVSLYIYDTLGRRIITLMEEREQDGGDHRILWNGKDDTGQPVSSGVYIVMLNSGNMKATRKIVFVE